MSDIVLHAENLGKRFRLGMQARYYRFSEKLQTAVSGLLRARPGAQPADARDFWALKDVAFEVRHGEVLGIIGRNGAGKSTLLKILSRITEPTEGRVRVRGRVASLLEVGTGFHPELTGRENIFLNGAILGMTRREVKRKFDEIVAFSETERFLDTPVKHFSSGMYMRLAFAVAAHLEPEILVVDEVLAVGDAEFQKKCLGKMGQVASSGRTVLLVSHNMAAISHLCRRSVLLDAGRIRCEGPTPEVIKTWLSAAENTPTVSLRERADRRGAGTLRLTDAEFVAVDGTPARTFSSGEALKLRLCYETDSDRPLRNVHVAIGVDDELGTRITHLSNAGAEFELLPARRGTIEIAIPRLPLTAGRYGCTLFVSVNHEIADWLLDAVSFDVVDGDFFGTGKVPSGSQGKFLIDHSVVLAKCA